MTEEIVKCGSCGSMEWHLSVDKTKGIGSGIAECAKCSNAQYHIMTTDTDLVILRDDPGTYTNEYRKQLEASYIKMFSE